MSNPQVPVYGPLGSFGAFPTLGATTITLADANHTLAQPTETCYQWVVVNGTQTAARNVVATLAPGFTYLVVNMTTGGFDILFGGSTGTTVPIAPGLSNATWVTTDGTNYVAAGMPNPFNVAASAGAVNSADTAPVNWSVLKLTTTGTTPGSFASIAIPASSTCKIVLSVVGQDTIGDWYSFDVFLTTNRISSAAPTINPAIPTAQNATYGGNGSACVASVAVSGDGIVVTVTGLTGQTMDWSCIPQVQVVT